MSAPATVDLRITETIIQQLGARRFVAMTGARDFMAVDSHTLQFDLPYCCVRNAGNRMRIKLQPDDTYSLVLYRIRKRGFQVDVLEECDGIYADQLQDVFTSMTGLFTSL